MNEPTTCPAWCTWRHNPIHVEGDSLADELDAVVRTHACNVENLEVAGHLVGVDLIQEEIRRGAMVELCPVMVDLCEVEPMTPSESRAVAALLLRAADEAEAVAR